MYEKQCGHYCDRTDDFYRCCFCDALEVPWCDSCEYQMKTFYEIFEESL